MKLYLLPIIAALIGWFTNYLAVKMLFHPRKPINLILFKLQGIFPKRQSDLAEKLGDLVATELFSSDDIVSIIKDQQDKSGIVEKIESKIDEVITVKLPEAIPMLAMVMNPELVSLVKQAFLKELDGVLESVMQKLSTQIDSGLNVKELVREKVQDFSSEKLEKVIFSIMKKELRFVELVGAVLGFIIGLIQVFLIQL